MPCAVAAPFIHIWHPQNFEIFGPPHPCHCHTHVTYQSAFEPTPLPPLPPRTDVICERPLSNWALGSGRLSFIDEVERSDCYRLNRKWLKHVIQLLLNPCEEKQKGFNMTTPNHHHNICWPLYRNTASSSGLEKRGFEKNASCRHWLEILRAYLHQIDLSGLLRPGVESEQDRRTQARRHEPRREYVSLCGLEREEREWKKYRYLPFAKLTYSLSNFYHVFQRVISLPFIYFVSTKSCVVPFSITSLLLALTLP